MPSTRPGRMLEQQGGLLGHGAALRKGFCMALGCVALGSCGGSETGTGPSALRVSAVEVTGAGNVIAAGQTLQLTAVARDSVSAAIAGATITWSSSPPSVASVSTTGLVRGISAGSATVTASAGGKTATWNLVVRDSASLPRVLKGRIERVNATLSGAYTVSDNLVLLADSALIINAQITIAPGASVTLWADERLELSGSITMDTTAHAARLTSAPSTVLPSEHEQRIYIGIGGFSVVLSDLSIRAGCPIAVVGRLGDNPNLVIRNSEFAASAGRPGTKAQPNGGNGCDVEIGTSRAQRLVQEQTGKPNQSYGYLGLVESRVYGGRGGDGYTMMTADGLITDNKWEGTAGNGGTGGHVRIASNSVDISRSDVQPGSGGGGGNISVNLRDGSGPNGEGESLNAVTGSAGKAGDLDLFAEIAIAAELLTEAIVAKPGGILVSGGNGKRGGHGGELRVRIGEPGARGTISVPAGVSVAPSPLNPNLFNLANISNAANGGHSENKFLPGGNGGQIIFDIPMGSRANLRSITLEKVSNGGLGFDGCAVRPKENGTNGGVGGSLRRKQTPMTHQNSFFGGSGGNGHPNQGVGGQGGRDTDNGNLPLGARGADGLDCPDWLGLSTTPSTFQHVVGQTSCPQLVASPMLTNQSMVAVNYSATVSGTTALTWGNASGMLQPGGSTTLPLTFNCSTTTSFNATLGIVGTPVGGGITQTISLPIGSQIFFPAVRLNHPLSTTYPAGTVIPLSRVKNGRRNPTHMPFCAYEHLHALSPAGISIVDEAARVIGMANVAAAETGPYPDPEEGGCGYGEIILVPSQPPVAPRRSPT